MAIKDLRVELTPHIKKAEVYARRQVLSKTLEGSWVTSFKGRGIEFAGYRKYQYGDDASVIDWRASLRSKDLLVRQFEEYRTFSVLFLLDVSNSMLFSSTGKLKAEYAAEMLYALADAMLKSGDAVGMSMFTDRLITKLSPNIGRGVLDRFSKELMNPKNYGGKLDFKKVIKQTMSILQSNAIIIIISDFINLPEGWQRYIGMMAEHFEVLGLMVKDVRDRDLPKESGQYTIKDPYTDECMYIDVKDFNKEYHERVREEEKIIRKGFEGVRGGFTLITTDKDYTDPILKLFRKRQFVTANL